MPAYKDILYSKSNGVAKIAINRPQVLNAFRPKTIETALVYRLREDEELIEVEDY